jgi:ribosomal protein S18 acetylase RimI-like enzyme
MSRNAGATPVDRFAVDFVPLEHGAPDSGEIARLSWDSELFGFGVADYRPGEGPPAPSLDERLSLWARENRVEMIGSRVPAERKSVLGELVSAGFRFVELQLRATLPRLRVAGLREPRLTVRPAVAADAPRLFEIATSAFTHGRYHSDPLFPRALADLRYRAWIEDALSSPSEVTSVFVVGALGEPAGFLHAHREGRLADLRLVAVDPERPGIAGPELFVGSLRALASAGAEEATARLSAANTAAVNLYAGLGFRFHEAEVVLHWRPAAQRRRPVE